MHDLPWWVLPLAICFVYAGIHGYLGIHVLTRKVIFVDLAMAQVAALGATYALVLGYDPVRPEDATAVFLFSLSFTILAAAVFAFTRMRHEKVPQEAFIGIVYASAAAIAILVLAKSPHGGEQLRYMLAGNILLVTEDKVAGTTILYSIVGLFHWIFRRRFFQITFDPEQAIAEGVRVRWWDFLFYASFGVVITSSVAVAGVLLVFAYLVVPASIAILFAQSVRSRIIVGWSIGVGVSVIGMTASYHGDLPTGPSIVGCFAAVLALAGIGHHLHHSPRLGSSLLKVTGGIAAAALLIWGSTFLARPHGEHVHEEKFDELIRQLHGSDESQQVEAIHHLEEMKDRHAVGEFVKLLGMTKSDRLKEHLAEALAMFGDASAAPALIAAAASADAALKVTIAESVLALRSPEGLRLLIDVLEKGEAVPRAQAAKILRASAGVGEDYDAAKDAAGNAAAIAKLRSWWETRGRHLRWREPTRRFE
jgi:zinc/manganese transport system permease protein